MNKVVWHDVGEESEYVERNEKGCFHHFHCFEGFKLYANNAGVQYFCSQEQYDEALEIGVPGHKGYMFTNWSLETAVKKFDEFSPVCETHDDCTGHRQGPYCLDSFLIEIDHPGREWCCSQLDS